MCLPKSRAQNKIWTQSPTEIHRANLFNRRDGYFRSQIDFKCAPTLHAGDFYCCRCTQIHHTPTHTCICTAAATAKLCQQVEEYRSRTVANAEQGRLSVKRCECLRVCVCFDTFILNMHARTVTCIQISMSRAECSAVE